MPSVDGLRALAVIAVLAYHLNLPWAPGGLVGVTVFFVISGFLITGILIVELTEKHTIDLKRFWLRRVRRLFPAIALVVGVTAVLAWFFNQAILYKLKTDVIPALCWVTNWWYIFRKQSYFDAIASPSPVLHFWSLSIEEQFYLIWPLVLLVLYRNGSSHRTMRRFCLVLAIASALGMALLYDPAGDPSRVYYGTDTRAFSLLIGAYLALIWPIYCKSPKHDPASLSAAKQKHVEIAGIICLVALIAMTGLISGTQPFWYRGGLALASVAAAVVIAAITLPNSILGKFFSLKPIVWLGTRSYGIYLWHYPLLLLMNPNNAGDPGVLKIAIELVIIVIVSELSYRLVENPLRHGAIGKTIRAYREHQLVGTRRVRVAVACFMSFVLLASAGTALALVQNQNKGKGLLTESDIKAGTSEGKIVKSDKSAKGDSKAGKTDRDSAASAAVATDKDIKVEGYEPLMIGDSVSIGLTDVFHQAYTGGLIDACGNRQIAMGQKVYDYYRDRKEVGSNVIIALGTNGSFTADELKNFVADIGSKRTIWIVTNRVPASWHRTTNQTIRDVAAKHKNIRIIDWEAYSANHDDWIGGDGVHLTYEGRKAYMQMIVDAIGPNKMIEAASEQANEKAGGAWQAPTDGSVSQEMHDALLVGMTPAARESRKVTGEPQP